jgi:hypothetical protein
MSACGMALGGPGLLPRSRRDPGREVARDKPAVRSTLCFIQGSRLFFDSRFISLHALFRAPLHADGRQYGRAQLTNYRIPSEPP